MPQIKFSHKYQKLLDSHNDVIKTATLLQVSIINLEDLSQEFLSYDTDNGTYELPKRGKYLMLIFLKDHEAYTTDLNLFTTLRRLCGHKNHQRWEKLVNYNVNQLKAHLEKQFKYGMSWDNYGLWHVDHIIPVTAFNFEKPEDLDFKKCWDLKNLQPLWAVENLKKNNKLTKPYQPSLLLSVG